MKWETLSSSAPWSTTRTSKSLVDPNQITRTANEYRQTLDLPAKSHQGVKMCQISEHLTPYISMKNRTHDFEDE